MGERSGRVSQRRRERRSDRQTHKRTRSLSFQKVQEMREGEEGNCGRVLSDDTHKRESERERERERENKHGALSQSLSSYDDLMRDNQRVHYHATLCVPRL